MKTREWSDSVLWYFNYYLGSRFVVLWSDGTKKVDVLINVLDGSNGFYGFETDVYPFLDEVADFKLILKHPLSMSKSMVRQYKSLCKKIKDTDGIHTYIVDTPASIHFLIKNGYDVFELIQNGFAIDERNI